MSTLARLLSCCALAALAGCPDPQASAPDALPAAPDAAPVAAEPPPLPIPPMREAKRLEAELALRNLEQWVRTGASDPKNAWALAHGIVAFGKDLKTTDNRKAIDVIFDYAELQKKVKGGAGITWPEKTEDDIPVQPHRDLMIKTFVESGVPLNHKFKLKGGKTETLDRLIRDAEDTFRFPADDGSWRNYAWSASTFLLARGDAGKINTSSGAVTLATLAERTMARLEIEQSFLTALMDAGRPDQVEKRRQGIYSHHCGGFHFVQAAVSGAAATKDPALLARARRQLDVVLFRWDAERRIYEHTLQDQPKYKWLLLIQELKFYGHVLETMALARDVGVLPSDPEIDRRMRLVMADLVDVINKLEPAYARQDAIGEAMAQARYDLIGDGAHAIRGLRRGLVAFFPPS